MRIPELAWMRRLCSCSLLSCTACQLLLWPVWLLTAFGLIIAIVSLRSHHLARLGGAIACTHPTPPRGFPIPCIPVSTRVVLAAEITFTIIYTKSVALCTSGAVLVALFSLLRTLELRRTIVRNDANLVERYGVYVESVSSPLSSPAHGKRSNRILV